ncbi:NADP-dependent malic enzyme [Dissostichus eleginoides]|uniref:NADP-dependent malic enzyme n=1 Tax=Dissostichus eleginoides TaxID=100907 RepID=A0AAD9EUK3_DISEL|nr:NADP-dependent malic enzyme [Dissostichus eleginoides]
MLGVVVLETLEYNVFTMSSVVGVVLLFVVLAAVFAEADTIVLLPACVNLLLLVLLVAVVANTVDTGLVLTSDEVMLLVVLEAVDGETVDDKDGRISLCVDVLLVLELGGVVTADAEVVFISTSVDVAVLPVVLGVVASGTLKPNVVKMFANVGLEVLFVVLAGVVFEAVDAEVVPLFAGEYLMLFVCLVSVALTTVDAEVVLISTSKGAAVLPFVLGLVVLKTVEAKVVKISASVGLVLPFVGLGAVVKEADEVDLLSSGVDKLTLVWLVVVKATCALPSDAVVLLVLLDAVVGETVDADILTTVSAEFVLTFTSVDAAVLFVVLALVILETGDSEIVLCSTRVDAAVLPVVLGAEVSETMEPRVVTISATVGVALTFVDPATVVTEADEVVLLYTSVALLLSVWLVAFEANIMDSAFVLTSDAVVLLVLLGTFVRGPGEDKDGGISVGVDVLIVLVLGSNVFDAEDVLTSSCADSVVLDVVVSETVDANVTMFSNIGVVLTFVVLCGLIFKVVNAEVVPIFAGADVMLFVCLVSKVTAIVEAEVVLTSPSVDSAVLGGEEGETVEAFTMSASVGVVFLFDVLGVVVEEADKVELSARVDLSLLVGMVSVVDTIEAEVVLTSNSANVVSDAVVLDGKVEVLVSFSSVCLVLLLVVLCLLGGEVLKPVFKAKMCIINLISIPKWPHCVSFLFHVFTITHLVSRLKSSHYSSR